MTLYDQVLNAPDTQTRKQALDKLCREKMAEGINKAVLLLDTVTEGEHYYTLHDAEKDIRQAAAELEKADE